MNFSVNEKGSFAKNKIRLLTTGVESKNSDSLFPSTPVLLTKNVIYHLLCCIMSAFSIFASGNCEYRSKLNGLLLLRQVLRSEMEELFNLTEYHSDVTGANGNGSIDVYPNFKTRIICVHYYSIILK